LPGRRADDDDPPTLALFTHVPDGRPHTRERATQVHRDHGVELVVGHPPQHAVPQHTGVGDEDVQPPVLRDGPLDEPLGRLRRTDGAGLRDRLPAVAGDL
jgi:hypothetical protein